MGNGNGISEASPLSGTSRITGGLGYFRGLARKLVRHRSTKYHISKFIRASNDLFVGFFRQAVHGADLKVHCRNKTGILLNVGCGDHIQEGWVNIDLTPGKGAFFHDLLDPFPIANGSVSYIHAEHVLEHLDFADAMRFVEECRRVLEPLGILRIIVPDSERYMNAYASKDATFFEQLKDLGGSQEPHPTKAAICNQMFHMGGDHRFGWDFETLEFVVRKLGFTRIERSSQNDASLKHCIDRQDWWRPVESFYAIITR